MIFEGKKCEIPPKIRHIFNGKSMETKSRTTNVRSLLIKLRGFRSQEKTTRTILMILSARKTGDHACSRESKIIQIV